MLNMDYESVIELLPSLYATNGIHLHEVLRNAEQHKTPESLQNGDRPCTEDQVNA